MFSRLVVLVETRNELVVTSFKLLRLGYIRTWKYCLFGDPAAAQAICNIMLDLGGSGILLILIGHIWDFPKLIGSNCNSYELASLTFRPRQ